MLDVLGGARARSADRRESENDTGSVIGRGWPDSVSVPAADHLDRLRSLELIQPLECVAELRRPLVVLRVARFLHALAQPRPDLQGLAGQKQQHVIDHPSIVFAALIPDAGRPAPLDMEIQAGPVRRVLRQMPGAGPHREDPPDNLQRLAKRRHVGIGAEIAGAGNRDPPHHQHARERLGERHGDLRITLVVTQPNIEFRLVFLDQRILQQQRLCFVRDNDRLEVGNLLTQRLALDTPLLFGE
jgi:hypothetical protein